MIDMEKVNGLVFDIKRFALEDGPGIRTTVFLKGCPLRCVWCHSPESILPTPQLVYMAAKCIGCWKCRRVCLYRAIGSEENDRAHTFYDLCRLCGKCTDACPTGARELLGKEYTPRTLFDLVERDRPYYERSGGGVTFSGGEPTAQYTFLLHTLRLCAEAGLHAALDTCGFLPSDKMRELALYTSLFLYDVKHIDPVRHKELTGVDNRLILDNLRMLAEMGSRVWVRLPLITGCNDSAENIVGVLELMRKFGLDTLQVLPLNLAGGAKYAWIGAESKLADNTTPKQGLEFIHDNVKRYGIINLIDE